MWITEIIFKKFLLENFKNYFPKSKTGAAFFAAPVFDFIFWRLVHGNLYKKL